VRTQIKKKRYAEKLRDNVQMSIEAAIPDALRGSITAATWKPTSARSSSRRERAAGH
jgi:hypothetical protein